MEAFLKESFLIEYLEFSSWWEIISCFSKTASSKEMKLDEFVPFNITLPWNIDSLNKHIASNVMFVKWRDSWKIHREISNWWVRNFALFRYTASWNSEKLKLHAPKFASWPKKESQNSQFENPPFPLIWVPSKLTPPWNFVWWKYGAYKILSRQYNRKQNFLVEFGAFVLVCIFNAI